MEKEILKTYFYTYYVKEKKLVKSDIEADTKVTGPLEGNLCDKRFYTRADVKCVELIFPIQYQETEGAVQELVAFAHVSIRESELTNNSQRVFLLLNADMDLWNATVVFDYFTVTSDTDWRDEVISDAISRVPMKYKTQGRVYFYWPKYYIQGMINDVLWAGPGDDVWKYHRDPERTRVLEASFPSRLNLHFGHYCLTEDESKEFACLEEMMIYVDYTDTLTEFKREWKKWFSRAQWMLNDNEDKLFYSVKGMMKYVNYQGTEEEFKKEYTKWFKRITPKWAFIDDEWWTFDNMDDMMEAVEYEGTKKEFKKELKKWFIRLR